MAAEPDRREWPAECTLSWALLLATTILAIVPAIARGAPPARTAYLLSNAPQLAASERRLFAELNRPVSWDLRDLTLEELAKLLQREGIPARTDLRTLDAAGIPRNLAIVAWRSVDTPRAVALRAMLERHGVGFTFQERDGRLELLLTTRFEAQDFLVTRLYPVSDLVDARGRGRHESDYARLVERLKQTTGGDEPGWVDAGGAGTIQVHLATRSMVVSTSVDVQLDIERELERLRRGAASQRAASDRSPHARTSSQASSHRREKSVDPGVTELRAATSAPPVSYSLRASPTERRQEQELERQLEQPVRWRLRRVPLDLWVRSLARDYNLPIRLDERSVRSAGISPQSEISVQIAELPLSRALDETLAKLELAYFRDAAGKLVVATRDECEQRVETRIYPVRDLARSAERGRTKIDFEPISQLIQNTTGKPEPGWVDDGGVGTIQFESGSRSLWISTTDAVHREIVALLTTLREVRRDQR